DGLASERGARVRRSGLLMYQLLTRAENDANLLDDHLLRLPEAEFVGIPKAILSDPATVERVVLGQTIAERFPDGPRVEKRERILLSVELIGDKLAVDARVLDAEVDLAQVNVFTAEPGFEASNSLFCIVKRLRRRSGNPRFHQIGGRETLCCRVDSD